MYVTGSLKDLLDTDESYTVVKSQYKIFKRRTNKFYVLTSDNKKCSIKLFDNFIVIKGVHTPQLFNIIIPDIVNDGVWDVKYYFNMLERID